MLFIEWGDPKFDFTLHEEGFLRVSNFLGGTVSLGKSWWPHCLCLLQNWTEQDLGVYIVGSNLCVCVVVGCVCVCVFAGTRAHTQIGLEALIIDIV